MIVLFHKLVFFLSLSTKTVATRQELRATPLSAARTSTSGGRTGPPLSPAMSIIAFIADTSYPLRRPRIA
jgi:hypothetical protein